MRVEFSSPIEGRTAPKNRTTHGMHGQPIYKVWSSIMTRCANPHAAHFPRYGGRGITVCEAWQTFEGFYADMVGGYVKGLQIDRIDNNKGYGPDNCRWVTPKQNSRNRRSNILVSYQGKNLCLAEAAEIAGVKYGTAHARLTVSGWPISRALGPEFGEPV